MLHTAPGFSYLLCPLIRWILFHLKARLSSDLFFLLDLLTLVYVSFTFHLLYKLWECERELFIDLGSYIPNNQ